MANEDKAVGRARKKSERRCPCCGRQPEDVPADQAVLTFRTLRQNDVHEVFRITGDRRLVFAPDVTPQEAAQAFGEAVSAVLQANPPRAFVVEAGPPPERPL